MMEEIDSVKRRKLEPDPTAVKECIFNTEEPLILKNILSWDILKWSPDDWIKCFEDSKLDFRIGTKQCTKVPQWENNCETVTASLSDVLGNNGELSDLWMYFDYKHMNQYFKSRPELLESLSWADFGLQDKNGKDSTIWIGTKGAYTPCHMDSYGYNIVAQVYGRKLWILFPPSSTSVLKPTRVPYEESSIYSNIHFSCGRNITDDIGEARVVELTPGDVLVVPKHWWHYVENLSTAISINMWIPRTKKKRQDVEENLDFGSTKSIEKDYNLEGLAGDCGAAYQHQPININLWALRESDDTSRLEEALVRFSVSTIIKGLDVDMLCGTTTLLNPNEMDLLDERIDLRQISWCVEQVVAKGGGDGGQGGNTPPNEGLSCVSPVAKVSPAELRRILLDKCGCHVDPDISHCENPKPKPLTAEDVINAFCHPNVISQVAKLLLATKKQ